MNAALTGQLIDMFQIGAVAVNAPFPGGPSGTGQPRK